MLSLLLVFCSSFAQARTIDSFSCEGQASYAADWRTTFTYSDDYADSSGRKYIYCRGTDGQWNDCAHGFYLTDFDENDSRLIFGGASFTWKRAGLRIEINKLTSVARFCVYTDANFTTAKCANSVTHDGSNMYFDVEGTGRCEIKWK